LVIFAMLAVPLNSYIQPVIIMSAIPFGIVGAVIGHLIMGYSLSVLSMFGVVALCGVVVNDSLVLIDFANRKERAGMRRWDAVHEAGIQRFRPIILTTLTTFGGLSPMIFETSRQARFLIPMALSLGYGILFATVITLVLVPSFYLIVGDIQKVIGMRFTPDIKDRQKGRS
jgi:multidrug efflux pump subunit AcrB